MFSNICNILNFLDALKYSNQSLSVPAGSSKVCVVWQYHIHVVDHALQAHQKCM